jgi:hypothetical protein
MAHSSFRPLHTPLLLVGKPLDRHQAQLYRREAKVGHGNRRLLLRSKQDGICGCRDEEKQHVLYAGDEGDVKDEEYGRVDVFTKDLPESLWSATRRQVHLYIQRMLNEPSVVL